MKKSTLNVVTAAVGALVSIFNLPLSVHHAQASPVPVGQGVRVPLGPFGSDASSTIAPIFIEQVMKSGLGQYDLPTFVGWTFDWSDEDGEFIPFRPLFSAPLSLNTGAGVYGVTFSSVLSASSQRVTRSQSFGLSGGFGMTSIAANYGSSNETFTGSLSTTMELAAVAEYPAAIVDRLALPSSSFDPEALAILSIADEDARRQAWVDAGFGKFVGFGAALRGSVIVRFSLNQANSFSVRDRYFSFAGSYGSISASATLGEAVFNAMQTSGISISMDGEGVLPPAIPPLDQLDSSSEQLAWANLLTAAAGTAKVPRGLFLFPASVIAPGLSEATPEWSSALVEAAGLSAQGALDALVMACRWNQPVGMKLFLSQRLIPTLGISYEEGLHTTRLAAANALEQLSQKLIAYMAGRNSSVPRFAAELQGAIDGVESATLSILDMLNEVALMRETLPSISIRATDPGYSPGGADQQLWVPFTVEVSNVGYFGPDNNADILAWIRDCEAPRIGKTLTFYEDYLQPGNIVIDRPRTYCEIDNGLPNLDTAFIYSSSIIPSGPGEGLRTLLLSMSCRVHNMSQHLDINMVDQLERIGNMPYELATNGNL